MAEKNIRFPAIEDIRASAWEKLSEKKIYFGHQSVGFNIMDGVGDLMRDHPQIKLNIIETRNPLDFNTPIFAHSSVGMNTDPKSKIDSFASLLKEGIGEKADIVLFKFCYVDITDKTDVLNVFTYYKNTMTRLEKALPKTNFVHVTVPLTSKPVGIRIWIKKAKNIVKKIIGRPVYDYHDNIKRNIFNEMVKKEYEGKTPVFDLANIESTYPDGTSSTFPEGGKKYFSMVRDYSYDGGHLNGLGRKRAAEQLLILFARLSES